MYYCFQIEGCAGRDDGGIVWWVPSGCRSRRALLDIGMRFGEALSTHAIRSMHQGVSKQNFPRHVYFPNLLSFFGSWQSLFSGQNTSQRTTPQPECITYLRITCDTCWTAVQNVLNLLIDRESLLFLPGFKVKPGWMQTISVTVARDLVSPQVLAVFLV